MPWIDPGWLDFKAERAEYRDNQRFERWQKAKWWQKIWIWLNGDSPNGYNHKKDWR